MILWKHYKDGISQAYDFINYITAFKLPTQTYVLYLFVQFMQCSSRQQAYQVVCKVEMQTLPTQTNLIGRRVAAIKALVHLSYNLMTSLSPSQSHKKIDFIYFFTRKNRNYQFLLLQEYQTAFIMQCQRNLSFNKNFSK